MALATPDLSLAGLQRIKVAKGADPVVSNSFGVIVYFELAHSSYVCVCQLTRDSLGKLAADDVATIPVQVRAPCPLHGPDWPLAGCDRFGWV